MSVEAKESIVTTWRGASLLANCTSAALCALVCAGCPGAFAGGPTFCPSPGCIETADDDACVVFDHPSRAGTPTTDMYMAYSPPSCLEISSDVEGTRRYTCDGAQLDVVLDDAGRIAASEFQGPGGSWSERSVFDYANAHLVAASQIRQDQGEFVYEGAWSYDDAGTVRSGTRGGRSPFTYSNLDPEYAVGPYAVSQQTWTFDARAREISRRDTVGDDLTKLERTTTYDDAGVPTHLYVIPFVGEATHADAGVYGEGTTPDGRHVVVARACCDQEFCYYD